VSIIREAGKTARRREWWSRVDDDTVGTVAALHSRRTKTENDADDADGADGADDEVRPG